MIWMSKLRRTLKRRINVKSKQSDGCGLLETTQFSYETQGSNEGQASIPSDGEMDMSPLNFDHWDEKNDLEKSQEEFKPKSQCSEILECEGDRRSTYTTYNYDVNTLNGRDKIEVDVTNRTTLSIEIESIENESEMMRHSSLVKDPGREQNEIYLPAMDESEGSRKNTAITGTPIIIPNYWYSPKDRKRYNENTGFTIYTTKSNQVRHRFPKKANSESNTGKKVVVKYSKDEFKPSIVCSMIMESVETKEVTKDEERPLPTEQDLSRLKRFCKQLFWFLKLFRRLAGYRRRRLSLTTKSALSSLREPLLLPRKNDKKAKTTRQGDIQLHDIFPTRQSEHGASETHDETEFIEYKLDANNSTSSSHEDVDSDDIDECSSVEANADHNDCHQSSNDNDIPFGRLSAIITSILLEQQSVQNFDTSDSEETSGGWSIGVDSISVNGEMSCRGDDDASSCIDFGVPEDHKLATTNNADRGPRKSLFLESWEYPFSGIASLGG